MKTKLLLQFLLAFTLFCITILALWICASLVAPERIYWEITSDNWILWRAQALIKWSGSTIPGWLTCCVIAFSLLAWRDKIEHPRKEERQSSVFYVTFSTFGPAVLYPLLFWMSMFNIFYTVEKIYQWTKHKPKTA